MESDSEVALCDPATKMKLKIIALHTNPADWKIQSMKSKFVVKNQSTANSLILFNLRFL